MRKPNTTARDLAGRLTSDESGAVMVIFALALVVMIGMAALALDLGALFVERRHAQTGADVGVLSGAQFASIDPDASTAAARQAVIDEVKSLTAGNLDGNDWATCMDAGKPAEFTSLVGETDCISFTFGLTKIRVRVPDQTFNTYFAGIIGIDTLSAAAAAEVEAYQFQSGDILPFGIPSGEEGSTLGCPSDHPNGIFPCDGPEAGNFNRLQISQWGTNPPPPHDCTHSNGMFEENLARGADHLLGTWPENTDQDFDVCSDPNVATPPGIVISKTGVAQSVLAPGLITGGSTFDGRLTDTPYTTTSSDPGRLVLGYDVDNEPLWSFIGSSLGTVPASCVRSSFNGSGESDWDEDEWVMAGLDPVTDDPEYNASDPSSHLEPDASFHHMARCFREYKLGVWDPGNGPLGVPTAYDGADYGGETYTADLFTASGAAGTNPEKGIYNLQLSPRWGWSPIGAFSNGTEPFKILSYKPIFLQLLVSGCNPHGCSWEWHAGEDPSSGNPGGNKIASILSFQLPNESVPESVFTFGPGAEHETIYTLTK